MYLLLLFIVQMISKKLSPHSRQMHLLASSSAVLWADAWRRILLRVILDRFLEIDKSGKMCYIDMLQNCTTYSL